MSLGDLLGGAGASMAGGLFGGLFRMVPEVLKWLDRKDERNHELAMFDKQLTADEQRSKWQLDQIHAQADAATIAGDMQAWVEGIKAQAVHTGVPLIDGINALVRPFLTFWWCIVLATAALWANYHSLTAGGLTAASAILQIWGPDEKAIVFSIIAFWFVDRALRKGGGLGSAH